MQIENRTQDGYQLRVFIDSTNLRGEWRANVPQLFRHEITERKHAMRHEWRGGYSRHNEIWRTRRDAVTDEVLGEEFLTENHAIMMYQPFLEPPTP